MRKPKAIVFIGRPKVAMRIPARDALERAASRATYLASEYHCPSKSGRTKKRVGRPATVCPPGWDNQSATNALREAIRRGRISEAWLGEVPRHVWHKAGDVYYEARTEKGTEGQYHAYPINPEGVPTGIRW